MILVTCKSSTASANGFHFKPYRRRWSGAFPYHVALFKQALSSKHDVVAFEEDFWKSNRVFQRLFLKHAGTDADHEDWKERAACQYQRALDPSTRNFAGYLPTAKAMLVGEQINPIYRKLRHWPFFAITGCAPYLHQALDQSGIGETSLVWTNAIGDEDHVLDVLGIKQLNVVALGKTASQLLMQLGVEHRSVPHPQFWKRFHHSDLPGYSQMLKAAIEAS